jgi:hypothetical protein
MIAFCTDKEEDHARFLALRLVLEEDSAMRRRSRVSEGGVGAGVTHSSLPHCGQGICEWACESVRGKSQKNKTTTHERRICTQIYNDADLLPSERANASARLSRNQARHECR